MTGNVNMTYHKLSPVFLLNFIVFTARPLFVLTSFATEDQPPATCSGFSACGPGFDCILKETFCTTPPCVAAASCAPKRDVHRWHQECLFLHQCQPQGCVLRNPGFDNESRILCVGHEPISESSTTEITELVNISLKSLPLQNHLNKRTFENSALVSIQQSQASANGDPLWKTREWLHGHRNLPRRSRDWDLFSRFRKAVNNDNPQTTKYTNKQHPTSNTLMHIHAYRGDTVRPPDDHRFLLFRTPMMTTAKKFGDGENIDNGRQSNEDASGKAVPVNVISLLDTTNVRRKYNHDQRSKSQGAERSVTETEIVENASTLARERACKNINESTTCGEVVMKNVTYPGLRAKMQCQPVSNGYLPTPSKNCLSTVNEDHGQKKLVVTDTLLNDTRKGISGNLTKDRRNCVTITEVRGVSSHSEASKRYADALTEQSKAEDNDEKAETMEVKPRLNGALPPYSTLTHMITKETHTSTESYREVEDNALNVVPCTGISIKSSDSSTPQAVINKNRMTIPREREGEYNTWKSVPRSELSPTPSTNTQQTTLPQTATEELQTITAVERMEMENAGNRSSRPERPDENGRIFTTVSTNVHKSSTPETVVQNGSTNTISERGERTSILKSAPRPGMSSPGLSQPQKVLELAEKSAEMQVTTGYLGFSEKIQPRHHQLPRRENRSDMHGVWYAPVSVPGPGSGHNLYLIKSNVQRNVYVNITLADTVLMTQPMGSLSGRGNKTQNESGANDDHGLERVGTRETGERTGIDGQDIVRRWPAEKSLNVTRKDQSAKVTGIEQKFTEMWSETTGGRSEVYSSHSDLSTNGAAMTLMSSPLYTDISPEISSSVDEKPHVIHPRHYRQLGPMLLRKLRLRTKRGRRNGTPLRVAMSQYPVGRQRDDDPTSSSTVSDQENDSRIITISQMPSPPLTVGPRSWIDSYYKKVISDESFGNSSSSDTDNETDFTRTSLNELVKPSSLRSPSTYDEDTVTTYMPHTKRYRKRMKKRHRHPKDRSTSVSMYDGTSTTHSYEIVSKSLHPVNSFQPPASKFASHVRVPSTTSTLRPNVSLLARRYAFNNAHLYRTDVRNLTSFYKKMTKEIKLRQVKIIDKKKKKVTNDKRKGGRSGTILYLMKERANQRMKAEMPTTKTILERIHMKSIKKMQKKKNKKKNWKRDMNKFDNDEEEEEESWNGPINIIDPKRQMSSYNVNDTKRKYMPYAYNFVNPL